MAPGEKAIVTLTRVHLAILNAVYDDRQIVADEHGQMEIARLVVAGLLEVDEDSDPAKLIMGTAGFGAVLMPDMLHPPVAGDYADN